MRQRVKIVSKEEIVRELYAIAGEDAVQTAEPMKNHTTFRVGGPVDYFITNYYELQIILFRRESSRHPSLLRSFCQPLFFFFVCPPFLQAHGLFYHEPSKSATNFFFPALFSIRSSGLVSFPTSDSLFHGFSPG